MRTTYNHLCHQEKPHGEEREAEAAQIVAR